MDLKLKKTNNTNNTEENNVTNQTNVTPKETRDDTSLQGGRNLVPQTNKRKNRSKSEHISSKKKIEEQNLIPLIELEEI